MGRYVYLKTPQGEGDAGRLFYAKGRSDSAVRFGGPDQSYRLWYIDEQKGVGMDDPDRWTLYATNTRVGQPPSSNPDFFQFWAYNALVLRAQPVGPATIGGVGAGYPPEAAAYWLVERYDQPDPDDSYVRLQSQANPGYYLSLDVTGEDIPTLSKPITIRNRPANYPEGGIPGGEQRWTVETVQTLADAGASAAEVA